MNFGYLKQKHMRNSLSLNTRTSVKAQYSLKNLLLSFSFTLLIFTVLVMINTFGGSEKSYASAKSEQTYKIKDQIKETASTANPESLNK
jgi:hypothetical protein